MVTYADIEAAISPDGFVARGGFAVDDRDAVPRLAGGRRVHTVVMIGNVGGAMWPHFRAAERDEPDPLDAWTRRVLGAAATRFGAGFVHPSDEPYQPFQRWAMRASDVWQSPIGLLIHPTDGLWHALRGALLFDGPVDGLPATGLAVQPCLDCDRPCLDTCPVDAFTDAGYDHESCRAHVRSGAEPTCLTDGCAARRACPVNAGGDYGDDQMLFHMRAFVGDD